MDAKSIPRTDTKLNQSLRYKVQPKNRENNYILDTSIIFCHLNYDIQGSVLHYVVTLFLKSFCCSI